MQCLLPGMCSETFSTASARAKNRAPTEADAAEILARGSRTSSTRVVLECDSVHHARAVLMNLSDNTKKGAARSRLARRYRNQKSAYYQGSYGR